MKALAEIQVQPHGANPSSREEVQRSVAVLREHGFETHTHALGTEVEGELADILTAVEHIHARLHEQGTPRITTNLVVHTREGEQPSRDHAIHAVEGPLIEPPDSR